MPAFAQPQKIGHFVDKYLQLLYNWQNSKGFGGSREEYPDPGHREEAPRLEALLAEWAGEDRPGQRRAAAHR